LADDGHLVNAARGGPGRLLAAVYALFALAAGARSAAQIATEFDTAPLAYSLSGLAAVVYLTVALTISGESPRQRRIARAGCAFEIAGVVIVGAASLVNPGAFPDQTVWSELGAGYGWVPLVLPFVGLAWLSRAGEAHGGIPPLTSDGAS
jgi:hypothetical protein